MADKKTISKRKTVEKIEQPSNVNFAMVSGEEVNFYDGNGKVLKTLEDGFPLVVLEKVSTGIKVGAKTYTGSKVEIDGEVGYVIFDQLKFTV